MYSYICKPSGFTDVKFVRIKREFLNKEKAEKLITDYKKKEGFKKDENGFRIKKMKIDKSYHEKGFKSWYEKGRE